jgi:hypothetical protein
MWGCDGWPHCGHVVSVTGAAFQLARRDRVLEREVFRFGTATSGPSLWVLVEVLVDVLVEVLVGSG